MIGATGTRARTAGGLALSWGCYRLTTLARGGDDGVWCAIASLSVAAVRTTSPAATSRSSTPAVVTPDRGDRGAPAVAHVPGCYSPSSIA